MSKETIIYANGIDIATIPLVQNEKGWYYYSANVNAYIKPLLAIFDTYVIPNSYVKQGYKKWTDGSHVSDYKAKRYSFDFSLVESTKISINHKFKVLATSSTGGSYVYGQDLTTGLYYFFVHTYAGYKTVNGKKVPVYPAVGTIIKAGAMICMIAPTWVTGYPTHLHVRLSVNNVRYIILDGKLPSAMATFKINDRVEFQGTLNTNIRATPSATNDTYIIGKASPKAVGVIKSAPITAENLTWYMVAFGDIWGVCVNSAMLLTTKVMTNSNATAYVPSNGAELEAVKKENGELKIQVGTLNGQVSTLTTQLTECQADKPTIADYPTEVLIAETNVRVRKAEGSIA